MLGAPISLETIHRNMRERDITTMEFEEEMEEIGQEDFDMPPGFGVEDPIGVGVSGEDLDDINDNGNNGT